MLQRLAVWKDRYTKRFNETSAAVKGLLPRVPTPVSIAMQSALLISGAFALCTCGVLMLVELDRTTALWLASVMLMLVSAAFLYAGVVCWRQSGIAQYSREWWQRDTKHVDNATDVFGKAFVDNNL